MGRQSDDDVRWDMSGQPENVPLSDVLVHAAGLAHRIPKNATEEHAFLEINAGGTLRILEALERRNALPGTFVFISSVSVYGRETGEEIAEDHPLVGTSPYAVSKIRAEAHVMDWSARNNVPAVILRLPLIVGDGAPGNLGAMVRHIRRGTYLRIGDGKARRSMVLAKDIASLIPALFRKSGIYNLTDGQHPSVMELDTVIAKAMGKRIRMLHPWLARTMARVGDHIPRSPFNSYRLSKLSHTLTFSDERAREELGWSPGRVLDDWTIENE